MAAAPAGRPTPFDLRPRTTRSPNEVLRIAHQGGFDGPRPYGPDNLARLAALGTHLLEFDLRVTADDELVVIHDPVVEIDRRQALCIAETQLEVLLAALPAEADVPAARAVIDDAARAGLGLYVDIKDLTSAAADRLLRHLDDAGMTERAILASGQPALLARCAAAAPRLPRAILFSDVDVDPVALAHVAGADFIHPCWERLSAPHAVIHREGWLDRVRREGLGVITWHEERRAVVEELYGLGVDGVCSDDPRLLAEVAAGDPS